MIDLFNINNYIVDTAKLGNHLHGYIVREFEESFCEYVGAKYGCTVNSATNAIFLATLNKDVSIEIPSIIPPVVLNAIIHAGNTYTFKDETSWVGDSYVLHDFEKYKIIDSAQKVEKNQFINEANSNDIMIFSFYPTKPVGGIDGGIIVSNDEAKIMWFKEACMNGMSQQKNNWERTIRFPGWKMYMNSFQAEIAFQNLLKLEEKKKKLLEIREIYNSQFNQENNSEHLYRLSIKDRDNFIIKMKEKGITCGIHYHAAHLNPIYSTDLNKDLPSSQKCSELTVSIPYHEALSKHDVTYIIESIRGYLSE